MDQSRLNFLSSSSNFFKNFNYEFNCKNNLNCSENFKFNIKSNNLNYYTLNFYKFLFINDFVNFYKNANRNFIYKPVFKKNINKTTYFNIFFKKHCIYNF